MRAFSETTRTAVRSSQVYSVALLSLSLVCGSRTLNASPVVDPYYAGEYNLTVLGTIAGVETEHGGFGGLTLQPGDLNSLLIGGNAGHRTGAIWQVDVIRDTAGHITGFSGDASYYAAAYGLTGGIDGSLVYGPDGVLFYSSYPDNHIGQIKPGSTSPDKLTNLIPMTGVASSVGAMTFVPEGFPGAGRLKIATYSVSRWYDGYIEPDGTGTFNITVPWSEGIFLGGSPEGILYVPIGSALFPNPTVLITEFTYGSVAAYEVDSLGNPIPSSRRTFASGIPSVEGITLDPVTGDILLSTFGRGNQIIRISGGIAMGSGELPEVHSPEPATWWLSSTAFVAFVALLRRRSKARKGICIR